MKLRRIKRVKISSSSVYVLTNDPSFTAWGWSVLDQLGNVVDVGCIKTTPTDAKLRIRKGDDRVRRVGELALEIQKIIKKYNIKYLISELPHGSQNAQAAFLLGAAAAILQTISVFTGISIDWYSEADAKKSVTTEKGISKDRMVQIIAGLYDVQWTNTKWRDRGIADSLAIYHVAKQESAVLKFIGK